MGKFKDLTGQVFGELTVIKGKGKNKRGELLWLCRCSCGNRVIKKTHALLHSKNASCDKCRYKGMGQKGLKDLVGERFGRLVILKRIGHRGKSTLWLAQCDCGNTHKVTSNLLLQGACRSCGCLRKELRTKHSMSNSKLYDVYISMKGRCYNPNWCNYKNYGGRGIKVCKEWKSSFIPFYTWAINNGYKEGLSIDRIDNNGNYEPSNCRWVSQKDQSNNTSRNRYLTYNGETLTPAQWAEKLGIPVSRIRRRIKSGWSIEKILFTPVTPYNERYKGEPE